MRYITLFFLLCFIGLSANAQRYMTKNGYIGFCSLTPLENIKADNNQVVSILDISTGEIVFQVLIKSFHFEKTLMEEHFNENYMESATYPKATFKGKITNLSSVQLNKPGTYEVTAEGDLTIRNVIKKVSVNGTAEVIPGGLNANTKFNILPEDYDIKIPGVVKDHIAKNLELTVKMNYTPM